MLAITLFLELHSHTWYVGAVKKEFVKKTWRIYATPNTCCLSHILSVQICWRESL